MSRPEDGGSFHEAGRLPARVERLHPGTESAGMTPSPPRPPPGRTHFLAERQCFSDARWQTRVPRPEVGFRSLNGSTEDGAGASTEPAVAAPFPITMPIASLALDVAVGMCYVSRQPCPWAQDRGSALRDMLCSGGENGGRAPHGQRREPSSWLQSIENLP